MRTNAASAACPNTNVGKVPHLVNSTPDLCRDIHEWPVEPLRGSTNFFAHAAFFTLRAHAAQNHNGRLGLKADIEHYNQESRDRGFGRGAGEQTYMFGQAVIIAEPGDN